MLSAHLKPSVVRFITPLCRGLLRLGITPNVMTIFGTGIVVLGSITLLAQGKLLASIIVIGIALLTDLLDGTMARISDKGPSKWGNFLDSTLDRIADSAILLALAYYLYEENDLLFELVLLTLVISSLVPYARAKAESLGIECKGGFAERPERLLILGISGALFLLGVESAITIGVWILFLTSTITVLQRSQIVWSATR
ncbi:MAG: phosphatidylinositol phosphate synthase [Candidatus Nanopelagicaceae bacterium]